MKTTNGWRVCAWAVVPLLAAGPLAGSSLAQSFPSKTVRYLMPQPPGSGADTIGRIVAAGMAQAFGQNVIVDNRAGAAGNVGAEAVAKAAPDGHTLLLGTISLSINPGLYPKLPYDSLKAFKPIGVVALFLSLIHI